MGYGNRISKTVMNPLTDLKSDFYVGHENMSYYIAKQYITARKSPLFKRVKFIHVYKHSESKNRYKLRGTYRITRNYGIAVLTDDNLLYYNEYRGKHTVLSCMNINDFEAIFLNGYVLDENTQITISSDIKEKGEPIYLFLRIVARVIGINVRRRSPLQMMTSLNKWLDLTNKKRSDKEITMYNKRSIMDELVRRDYFDFVPPEMLEKMTAKGRDGLSKRNLMFFTCLGIIFMHRSSLRAQWDRNYNAKNPERMKRTTMKKINEYMIKENQSNETE